MARDRKVKVTLYLEAEQATWLSEKESQGYSKAGIVRVLIRECMSNQLTKENPASFKVSGTGVSIADAAEKVATAKPTASVDGIVADLNSKLIEEAIEAASKDENLDKETLKRYQAMDWGFKNIDHIDRNTAFLLGFFKADMLWKLATGQANLEVKERG